jgi:hypothetical protein
LEGNLAGVNPSYAEPKTNQYVSVTARGEIVRDVAKAQEL